VGADTATLDEIVLRGLEREPTLRWQSARDMAVAIEASTRGATASEIEAWIRDLAGDTLATRADDLLAVERFSGMSAPGGTLGASADPPAPPASTSPPLAPTLIERASSPTTLPLELAPTRTHDRGAKLGVLLTLAVLVLGGAAFAVFAGGASPSAAPPALSALPPPLRATGAPSDPGSARDDAVPSGQVLGSAKSVPSPAAPASVKPPAPANTCQPPYTLDAHGINHPKPACYR